MRITVLGSASIGGVPEWDCSCSNCTDARKYSEKVRTRSSITVSLDTSNHILFDAGHDLKTQLERNKITPPPNQNQRESKIDSVFITHGHADHTVGVSEFCTGKSFNIPVYGPPDLIDFMFGSERKPNYFGELGRLAKNYVAPTKLEPERDISRLGEICVKGFEIPHTKEMGDGSKYPTSTYAYEITHGEGRVIYAPDLGKLDHWLLDRVEGADVFIVDATFWWDNELERISGIPVTSYQLGHVPQEESLEILKDADIGRVIYTHFNHTNPSISTHSKQRDLVEEAGLETGFDGMILDV